MRKSGENAHIKRRGQKLHVKIVSGGETEKLDSGLWTGLVDWTMDWDLD